MTQKVELNLEVIRVENENVDEESINFKDEKDLNNFLEILSPFINDYPNFNEKDYKIDSVTKPILLNIFGKTSFYSSIKIEDILS